MGPKNQQEAERAIAAFLKAVGAPIDDLEVVKAPKLVADAWCNDLLEGYGMDPALILKDGTASDASSMVVLRNLPMATVCPHHLMPSTGTADVGYVPSGRVVGFGALERLLQCFSKRLALQEDIAENVAKALMEHLGATAAACRINMEPTCLTARGDRPHPTGIATTCAWHGDFKDSESLRLTFLGYEPADG